MNQYILSLGHYSSDQSDAIRQNIRFWCIEFKKITDDLIYITSSYLFTPEFLLSKGIPEDCITPAG